MFYVFVRNLFKYLMIPFFRYTIEGRENIPKSGPVIIAANHRSYADPIIAAVAVKGRQVNFMTKAELFDKPLLGPIMRHLNAFPVKKGVPDKAALVRSLKVLDNGQILLVFPEGTRYKKGGMGPAYSGATTIALKTGTAIIPMGIIGTDKIMPNGSKLPHLPKLKVVIGKPIKVEKVSGFERKEKEEKLTAEVMKQIEELTQSG